MEAGISDHHVGRHGSNMGIVWIPSKGRIVVSPLHTHLYYTTYNEGRIREAFHKIVIVRHGCIA